LTALDVLPEFAPLDALDWRDGLPLDALDWRDGLDGLDGLDACGALNGGMPPASSLLRRVFK